MGYFEREYEKVHVRARVLPSGCATDFSINIDQLDSYEMLCTTDRICKTLKDKPEDYQDGRFSIGIKLKESSSEAAICYFAVKKNLTSDEDFYGIKMMIIDAILFAATEFKVHEQGDKVFGSSLCMEYASSAYAMIAAINRVC